MKQFWNAFLGGMMVLLLGGCQSMPKEPKQPESSPKVPINKTIPPEIERGIYENPAN
jgi:starvation-inducible outer membrane lipoprotein